VRWARWSGPTSVRSPRTSAAKRPRPRRLHPPRRCRTPRVAPRSRPAPGCLPARRVRREQVARLLRHRHGQRSSVLPIDPLREGSEHRARRPRGAPRRESRLVTPFASRALWSKPSTPGAPGSLVGTARGGIRVVNLPSPNIRSHSLRVRAGPAYAPPCCLHSRRPVTARKARTGGVRLEGHGPARGCSRPLRRGRRGRRTVDLPRHVRVSRPQWLQSLRPSERAWPVGRRQRVKPLLGLPVGRPAGAARRSLAQPAN